MKHIGNLSPAPGSRHKKKRIGRGAGSGHGGTSTRGHKGHQSRSGGHQSRGFEGGQMTLTRRIPKFGFTNINRIDEKQIADGVVSKDILYSLGVIRKKSAPVKILGNGELSAKLAVTCDKISEAAKQKIESAGGAVTVNG